MVDVADAGTGRSRAGALLMLLVALVALWPAPTRAQPLTAAVTLAAQTRYTTPDRSVLHVEVAAVNTSGVAIEDLSMALSLGPAVVSRLAYDQMLVVGPPVIDSTTEVPLEGSLATGEARTLRGEVDMAALPNVAPDDSRIYPLRIEIRSAEVAVGQINSAAIHIVRDPEAPIVFAWRLEFTSPGPAFGPDGTFRDPALAASLAPGGSLAARVDALRRIADRGATIDAVIQPSLVRDVADMADGYVGPDGSTVPPDTGAAAAAARFLAQLTNAVASPGVAVIAPPMFGPTTPSLLAAGMGPDLNTQEQLGARTMAELLGVTPVEGTARPVDGRLDERSLERYADQGTLTLLGDAATVARPVEPNGFAPAPTARIGGTDESPVTVLLPDPGTQALMSQPDLLADPVRAAQGVLGELAVIWKEQPKPAPPTVRGLTIALPDTLPPPVWGPLVDRIVGAPFLRRAHAATLVELVEPPGPAATLATPDSQTFTAAYVDRIRSLERDVATYRSMLAEPSEESERLRDALLQAESAVFLGAGEPGGVPWLDEVARVTGAAFAGTTPQVSQAFTLTSTEGTLPLRMGDPGPLPLHVTVRLESSRFSFPEGAEQEVTLVAPDQVVEFAITATGSGQSPIRVVVEAPDGRPISEQTVVVRTSAVNVIALVVTAAAALVLLVVGVRRWMARRAT